MIRIITLILFKIFFFVNIVANVTFTYEQITICEGNSFNLTDFEHNEVIVPVGWEIIGWDNITDGIVTPTVSPSVYTLSYREVSNSSVIYKKDLAISLRSRPILNINASPPNNSTIAAGDEINIGIDVQNYDYIYWQCLQNGIIYSDSTTIEEIAQAFSNNKLTYKIWATNDECPNLVSEEVNYKVVDINGFTPGGSFGLSNAPPCLAVDGVCGNFKIKYCEPVDINQYTEPITIRLKTPDGVKTFTANDDYVSSTIIREDDYVRLTRFEFFWKSNDEYTRGEKLLEDINLIEDFYLEYDLYFKELDSTHTYRYDLYFAFENNCDSLFEFVYSCAGTEWKGKFGISTYNCECTVDSIVFVNKTLPGEYIPVTDVSPQFGEYYITFDPDNLPSSSMMYDVTIYYKDYNDDPQTFLKENWLADICYKDTILNYVAVTKDIWDTRYWAYGNYSQFAEITNAYRASRKKGDPPNWLRTAGVSICEGDTAVLTLLTNILNTGHDIVWDHPDKPLFVQKDNSPVSNYTYELKNGKHHFTVPGIDPGVNNTVALMVSPDKTTTYTGTSFGVEFSYTVSVKRKRPARDTAICSGDNLNLKDLEKKELIQGSASWNVENTIVSPFIETKYLIYGKARNLCDWADGATFTDTVTVSIKAPLWVRTGNLGAHTGDNVNLRNGLNSNGDSIRWFESDDTPISGTITAVEGETVYKAIVSNGCKNDTAYVTVFATSGALTVNAVDDYITLTDCSDTVEIDILTNDTYFCGNPTISLINSSLPNARLTGDNKIRYSPHFDDVTYFGKKDSVLYTVDCGIIDTAVVYIEYPVSVVRCFERVSALNDSVSEGACGNAYVDVAVLENDTAVFFGSLGLTIITNPKLSGSSVQVVNGYTVRYFFNNISDDVVKDSVQYKIAVDTKQDSAWIYITLTKDEVYASTTDTLTAGQVYNFNSKMLYNSGIYKDTIISSGGCDSIITLRLNVVKSLNESICDGDHYFFNNKNETIAGTYSDTISLPNGCDSIVVLHLTINEKHKTELLDTITVGQAYTSNGFNLPVQSVAGTITDTLYKNTIHLCDSIVILKLYVGISCTPEKTIIKDTVCADNPYVQNGFNLPRQIMSGTVRDTLFLTKTDGCDSLVILNLRVNDLFRTVLYDTINVGKAYNKNEFNLPVQNQPGTITDSIRLNAVNTCDSTVVLNLHVKCVGQSTIIYDTICQYEAYSDNGFNLPVQNFSGGPFMHKTTVPDAQGCDSTINLHLIVNTVYQENIELFVDPGSFVLIDNQHYTEPAVFSRTYASATLCDSIVTYFIRLNDDPDKCPPIIPALFFSPNKDAFNDYWLIENLDCYEEYTLHIYDKFGKLLVSYENNFESWDGNYLNKPLPSTDYWYIIEIKGQKAQVGHFTLRR